MSIISRVLHLRVGSVQRSGDEARHTHFYIDSNSAFPIFMTQHGDSSNCFKALTIDGKAIGRNCCSHIRDSSLWLSELG